MWDWSWYATYGETSRMMKIKLNNSISLIHGVKILLKRAEELHLELNGVKNAIDELDEDGFAQLKHLHVQNGHELLYILNFAPSTTLFPKLESLFLRNLIKLEKMCDGELYAESFSKLRILKVEKCDMLEHLFSFTEHKKFSQLQEIEVIDCKNLKEIFGEESVDLVAENKRNNTLIKEPEEVSLEDYIIDVNPLFSEKVIPNLEWLGLDADNITSRCLDRISARGFRNLKVLGLVGFPNSEYLRLSAFPTLEDRFWNAKVPTSFFYSLKWLVLDMCLDTSCGIPFNVLCNLKNLETLEIRSCDSLKEVFDMEGQLNVDGHTLKKSHQEVLAFNNLKSFEVHNCCSLRHIFTPSIILGLAQLKEIEVINCALIEEIISKEEENEADIEKIMITQLNSIILESLPNLTSFYSGMNTLECPALKAITVAKCPQIETFVFADIKHQSDNIVPLLSEKLIWHNQLHADSFGKLKQVTIKFCEKLMTIVLANNSQGLLTFHNLESLHVKKCWSMKSLFPVSTATSLVKLKELRIYSCELEEIVENEEVEGAPSLDLSGKV
ncbi:hypothetical protein Patl1_07023 [Pistacia atlantica]|uniref:Uncharacterized protein n=1 Tax=Pistacia atlantica TaxID=434234 RepID=A0ACC1AIM4_9ROSI|nr:hypothetical protein Patl1_07023 [Pistacia atlantica]